MKVQNNKVDIAKHFTEEVSQEIHDYIRDTVLLDSRYIFTWRVGKQQYGYCTHCKKEFKTTGLKHKKFTMCPECHSNCGVRASGMGRQTMRDSAYFVYYEKSRFDPKVITARGFLTSRDYTGDFREVETRITQVAVYIFEQGNSQFYYSPYYFSSFEKQKTVFSLFNSTYVNFKCFCSKDSIQKAVQGTIFQYSTWEDFFYMREDMVKFFSLVSKYPCIEYLSKMGLTDLVKAKLFGYKTFGAINWNGKTINKVLKLSKQEIKEVTAVAPFVSTFCLWIYQQGKKDGSNLTIDEARDMSERFNYSKDELDIILKYTRIRKAYSYIKKQHEKKPKDIRFHTFSQIAGDWRDYIRDCITLEMNLTDEYVLYPPNLHRAHQNTIKQIKIKENKILDEKINRRVKILTSYTYQDEKYLIRPAASSLELIDEGKKLNHCVGTYADRYAKGETNIFVVRKVLEPQKPFYTMEIRKNEIIQVRGKKNCNPTKEVKTFIDKFEKVKIKKKATGRKVAV